MGQALGARLSDLSTSNQCGLWCNALVFQMAPSRGGPDILYLPSTSLHSFPPRAPSADFLFQQHRSSNSNSSSTCTQWQEEGKVAGNAQGRVCAARTRAHAHKHKSEVEFCWHRHPRQKQLLQCSIKSVCVTSLEHYEEKPVALAARPGLAQ